MSGHAAREYKFGKRMLYPDGMQERYALSERIITRATKALLLDVRILELSRTEQNLRNLKAILLK